MCIYFFCRLHFPFYHGPKNSIIYQHVIFPTITSLQQHSTHHVLYFLSFISWMEDVYIKSCTCFVSLYPVSKSYLARFFWPGRTHSSQSKFQPFILILSFETNDPLQMEKLDGNNTTISTDLLLLAINVCMLSSSFAVVVVAYYYLKVIHSSLQKWNVSAPFFVP